MILTLLLLIIGLIIVVITTINLWLPKVAKWFVEKKSNFPTIVQKSNIQLTKGIVDLEGINLKNPKGRFEQENFVTINKISAQVEYKTLFEKQIVIPQVTLDLENLTCEKNKDGEINALVLVDSFTGGDSEEDKKKQEEEEKKKQEEEEKKKQEEEGGEKKEEESKTWIIRKLTIRLGTIELYNLTAEDGEHKINLNKTLNFEDVSLENKKEIITQILQDEDLQKAGCSLALKTALGQGTKYISDAGKKLINEYIPPETVNQIKDSIPDDFKKAAADGLKKLQDSEDIKQAASKVADAIPDEYKKAAANGLKKLFG